MFSTGLQSKKAHEHALRLCFRISANFRLASGLKLSMTMRWTINYKSYTTTIWDPLRYQQEWSWHFRALNKTNCRMMYVSIRKKRPHLKENTNSFHKTQIRVKASPLWPHGYLIYTNSEQYVIHDQHSYTKFAHILQDICYTKKRVRLGKL